MKRILIVGATLALVAALTAGLSAADRKGMIGVGVGGGIGLPMGTFDDVAKLGWRAGVGVGYFVQDNIAIGASGVFAQNKADSIPSGVSDVKTQMIEFGAWGKYFFKMESEKIAPYVTLGLGGNNNKLKVDPDSLSSDGETFLGGKIGAGAMFGVSPKASIFLEGAFHNYAKSDFPPLNYIAAQVGVAFMFGGSGGGASGGTE